MNIFGFIKKLLPRVERSTVIEDLRLTEKEMVNMVLPSWEAASTYFKINKPKAQEHDKLQEAFYQLLKPKGVKPSTFLMLIQLRLIDLHKNIQFLQNTIEDNFQKDILPEGLTSRGAYILRAAGNFSVMTRYLLSLLNYIYTVEAAKAEHDLDPNLTLSKAEYMYVERSFERFCHLFNLYAIPAPDFKKQIEGMGEYLLTKDAESLTSGMIKGPSSVAFNDTGIVGFMNPIYLLRLPIARWQNSRYESSKNKKQQLELRLLYLQMQRDEAKDASVAKEIEQLQTRIDKLEWYLREVEESVGA